VLDEDSRRRLDGKVQRIVGLPHDLDQFIIDDLYQRLSRCQALEHLLPRGTLPDTVNEFLDHRQRHVGFQQRDAHFAQRLADTLLSQAAFAAQLLYGPGQALGQIFEHGLLRKQVTSL